MSDVVEMPVYFEDVYIHPRDGVSTYSWAFWTKTTRLVLRQEPEKILRRMDLKSYPLRIATPVMYKLILGTMNLVETSSCLGVGENILQLKIIG